jgi:hypothetical protein
MNHLTKQVPIRIVVQLRLSSRPIPAAAPSAATHTIAPRVPLACAARRGDG